MVKIASPTKHNSVAVSPRRPWKRSVAAPNDRAMLSAHFKFRILVAIVVLIFYVNMSNMLQLDGAQLQSRHSLFSSFYPGDHSKDSATAESVYVDDNIIVQQYKPIPARKPGIQKGIVMPGDFIYYSDPKWPSWDNAPVVLESHKLIFFTIPKVGCTVWKQLFRRMEGFLNWQSQDYEVGLPHNPVANGLKYLHHYSLEQASEMMTSTEWTRAMMVREPKKRFLSAFLDKSVGNYHRHIIERCCPDKSCVEGAQNISGFLRVCETCDDAHWRPQSLRVDYKFWPYIDLVIHVEDAAAGAKQLLERIGAWDMYGKSGWGANSTMSIFGAKVGAGMTHSTYAQWEVWKWYTPDTEDDVERFYQGDYENPLFGFTQDECITCPMEE